MTSIGPHTFLYILGNVGQPTHVIEGIEKRGVDGVVLRDIGLRSPPFQLETIGAYATRIAAVQAFHIFDLMKTLGAQVLIKDGVNYNTDPTTAQTFLVQVMGVEQLSLKRTACNTAGPTLNHVLRCNWTLIPVPS